MAFLHFNIQTVYDFFHRLYFQCHLDVFFYKCIICKVNDVFQCLNIDPDFFFCCFGEFHILLENLFCRIGNIYCMIGNPFKITDGMKQYGQGLAVIFIQAPAA